ncbi:AAA family ATPase [Nitratireductor luteus]|uniref:AAA family ATPase n=1 Tax=Nitratireductor luteus TaxID=2976980 RepID=UPI00223EE691|nr:AAA family ATPase [Nitratireductor luteus]
MALIKTIRFKDYKKFENFTVACKSTNILVGPNNAGKSTILDALRILDAVDRYAAKNRPSLYDHPRLGPCGAYNVPLSYLEVSNYRRF